jgi:hypothetical protein
MPVDDERRGGRFAAFGVSGCIWGAADRSIERKSTNIETLTFNLLSLT